MFPISNYLQRLSNSKFLFLFLLVFCSFPLYFFQNARDKLNELSGKSIDAIDITFGFNPQNTLYLVDAYGDAARAYYAQSVLTTDVAFPMVSAFFFGIMLTMLFRGQSLVRTQLLPFISMIFDYAENTCIVSLLYSYPQQSIYLATLCEIFKMLKWLTLAAVLILMIYGLLMKLLRR